jgi:hypothetical protein
MKKSIILISILATFSIFSACKKEQILLPKDRVSEVNLNVSSSEFDVAFDNRNSASSDPFTLNSITQNGSEVNINISYSGGCSAHEFNLIWDGTISSSSDNSAKLDFIIQHNANGDACEAWITENITIDLTDLSDSIYFPDVVIDVYNGGSSDDSLYYGGDNTSSNPFEIIESDTCNMTVIAQSSICGFGKWGSLWFVIDNSITMNEIAYIDTNSTPDYFYNFNYYLQPLAVDASLADFTPVEGKKYSIGVRKADIPDFPEYNDIITCMAWAGPSISVKIMCIKEIE